MAVKRRQPIRYTRQTQRGIRWGRVLGAVLVLAILTCGAWSFFAPNDQGGANVAPEDRRGLVFYEGKWLLPGEIPRKEVAQPKVDEELTAAIKAREKKIDIPPLPEGAVTESGSAGATSSDLVDRRASTFKPYDGKSLQQITADIATHRFIGKSPQHWGEHIVGVTGYLTHVWQKMGVSQTHPHGVKPQITAKPLPGMKATIALTLDACGGKKGSRYDAELIAFLRENNIKATLFITSSWLKQNTDVAKELARDPLFELGAHGTRHKPASIDGREAYGIKGTASLAELVREVEGNARDIESVTGKRPRWYRSGTAFYDDIAVAVIRTLGFGVAGFSIAGDEGATLSAENVASRVLMAKDGDILLLHMNKPDSGTCEGLMQVLPILKQRGFGFVHLSGE